MNDHTPTPWFVSGVRFRMNGGEWHSINRYDETLKRDENIACVGYDSRTGVGLPDAHFIVKAVNAHDVLVKALEEIEDLGANGATAARLGNIAHAALLSIRHVGSPKP
jgi:hypothetical protein